MSESRTAKRAIQLPLIGVAFLWAMMMLAQYVDSIASTKLMTKTVFNFLTKLRCSGAST